MLFSLEENLSLGNSRIQRSDINLDLDEKLMSVCNDTPMENKNNQLNNVGVRSESPV